MLLLLLLEDVQFVCSWHRIRSRGGGGRGCWCNCRRNGRRRRRLSRGDGWNRWNSPSISTANDGGCSLLMLYRRGGYSASGLLGVPTTAVDSVVKFRSLLLILMMLLWLRWWRSYMRLLTRSWLLSTWRRRYEVSLSPNWTGQNDINKNWQFWLTRT